MRVNTPNKHVHKQLFSAFEHSITSSEKTFTERVSRTNYEVENAMFELNIESDQGDLEDTILYIDSDNVMTDDVSDSDDLPVTVEFDKLNAIVKHWKPCCRLLPNILTIKMVSAEVPRFVSLIGAVWTGEHFLFW